MDQEKAASDQKKQLDAVLDAALDELDDDDVQQEVEAKHSPGQQQAATIPKDEPKSSTPKPVYGPERPPASDMGSFDDVMKQMFHGGDDVDPAAALDSFMKQLQKQLASEMEKMEDSEPKSSPKKSDTSSGEQATASAPTEEPSDSDIDHTISKLLNDMANANVDDGDAMGGEEAMLKEMLKEFEKMGGGGFDQDAVVDGMMQQLVSKDIMYDPMKQVTERFPSWLEENRESLSEEEYENRSQQYECFQKLIYVYETEPENLQKLMQLMQDVQEYGQPPPAIIKEIAPGLELDEEGVPKLDGMGGLPFGENEECSIM